MYSWQFSKNFPLPKNGGHFEFSPKMEKRKFASISVTVRERVISPTGYVYSYLQLFAKNGFPAIFDFHIEILAKMQKLSS